MISVIILNNKISVGSDLSVFSLGPEEIELLAPFSTSLIAFPWVSEKEGVQRVLGGV